VTNAFDMFSTILNSSNVLPSTGHYGGVVIDFDEHGGGHDDDHYIEVAVN
jgi:hypothetical protein